MSGDYQHSRRKCKHLPPLDDMTLRSMALSYVGRYATTQARLARYLDRKIRERGWVDQSPPPISDIVARYRALGYVNDEVFAQSRASTLSRRGYGAGRIKMSLFAAGVDSSLAEDASRVDPETAYQSALAYARRKQIGPFAHSPATPEKMRKIMAAMLRAGHSFELVRTILAFDPVDNDAI
jgi:regulatory protein